MLVLFYSIQVVNTLTPSISHMSEQQSQSTSDAVLAESVTHHVSHDHQYMLTCLLSYVYYIVNWHTSRKSQCKKCKSSNQANSSIKGYNLLHFKNNYYIID